MLHVNLAISSSCASVPDAVQVYDSVKQLRYGHLMIMTDQDHDGSHIKGLIMNFFHHFYPTLLQLPGFLLEFITPIVKASVLHHQAQRHADRSLLAQLSIAAK